MLERRIENRLGMMTALMRLIKAIAKGLATSGANVCI